MSELAEKAYTDAGITARQRTLTAYDKVGLTPEVFAKAHKAALRAGVPKAHWDASYETWRYSRKLPDHPTRLRAVQLGLTVLDSLPSQKIEHGGEVIVLKPDKIVKRKKKNV